MQSFPISPGGSKVDKGTLDRLRSRLEEEHQRLVVEVEDMVRASEENLSEASGENNYRDHMADQGTATFSRELDMTLVDNSKKLLAEVERAIERFDEGTYGTCLRCGQSIPESRLDAIPTADLCIACKEKEESR